jgi:hypothetical protein
MASVVNELLKNVQEAKQEVEKIYGKQDDKKVIEVVDKLKGDLSPKAQKILSTPVEGKMKRQPGK